MAHINLKSLLINEQTNQVDYDAKIDSLIDMAHGIAIEVEELEVPSEVYDDPTAAKAYNRKLKSIETAIKRSIKLIRTVVNK